ncbi:Nucleoside 5-triphosphatase RdgB (dHAPTP, dITP, XTP-specific) [Thermobrachium celere DSM 8682]|uniref:dITP/XTP pyrophosphatase n=2 Tax=Thermobrachium TaxID=150333 RepID=R7RV57_9CLOT|nr:Nucleoside 5-triphosphatase RdgB (dHAPTP, dITP, XTP-specific) [Thermobrachium celere DSM 8682]
MRLIVASNNNHKVQEIKEILKPLGIEAVSLKEAGISIEIVEDGTTFEENAYKKAKTIYDITKEAVLADDSGLEVYALNNAPGVYSARFAGEECNYKKNNEKLLELLKDMPDDKRGARFVCTMILITKEGEVIKSVGTVEGVISKEPRGTNGFGYDPLFIVPELDKTFAELSEEEKNKISHRARALENLKGLLEDYFNKRA